MIRQTSDIILSVQPSPIAWARFKAEFLALYTEGLAARSTRAKLEQVLRLVDALGVRTTADLTPELVARFLASRPPSQSPHTARGLLMQLRTICSYAESRRHLTISPFRLRKVSQWVRVGAPLHRRAATLDEIHRLLELLRKDAEARQAWAGWRARRLYAVVTLVAYTGLRKGEALNLHVEDLDLAAGVVHLVERAGRKLKTAASARPVPLPPAAVPALKEWLDHRLDAPRGYPMPPASAIPWLFPTCDRKAPWIHGSPTSKAVARLKAAGARIGSPDITFQMLRRSLATHLEHFGAGPAMIQRILRHTSSQVTEAHYRRADLANMADAVKDVRF